MAGTLYVCATPIGNLEDITYRLVRVLSEADMIAAEDTRRTLRLLNHLQIEKPLTSYFEHNKREKGEYIVSLLKEGRNVALVSDAGTPAISDPGEELVAQCAAAGIEVVGVPGPCAAINALCTSALPTGRFAFEGFLSVNKKRRREHLEAVAQEERTMVFYEAPHKLLATLRDLFAALGERRVSLCREMTKVHEEVIRTTLSEACEMYAENAPRGEFALVVEGKRREREVSQKSPDEVYAEIVTKCRNEKEAMRITADICGISRREVYAMVKIDKK